MKNILFISLFLFVHSAFAQQKKYEVACVGFYNLENLYDTIDDPKTDDAEFLPNGSHLYTGEVYKDKLSKLSEVISQLGIDDSPDGVAILGVSEIENNKVLQDLVSQPKLKNRNYKIVHWDSKDLRGVDVAMLYNPKYFKLVNFAPLFVDIRNDDGSPRYTRDVLWVSGELRGEMIHVFVNHWPSRRGGEQASAPYRNKAAAVVKQVVDSLMTVDINTKVFIMGDLNDDPVNASVAKVLGAKGNKQEVNPGGLYNPWLDYYKQGIGTLAYNDSWNLFDQVMLSSGLLNKGQKGFFFQSAKIFDREFLKAKTGRFKGYPLRTFNGSIYAGGYSDHFPVYTVLLKELPPQ